MCDNAALPKHAKQASKELPPDHVASLFSDPLLKGLDVVRITGGEPFCRKDLIELVCSLVTASAPRILYITTNGSEPVKIASLVKSVISLGQRTRLHIQLSVDAIGTLHDRIRSYPGLFDRLKETMEQLWHLQKDNAFYVGITQTILKENVATIEAVRNLAHSMGFGYKAVIAYRVHENNLVPGTTSKTPSPLTLRSFFSSHELETIYREIMPSVRLRRDLLERRTALRSVDLWKLGELWLHQGGKNRLLKNLARPSPACVALFAYCRILPYGDLVPCTLLAEPVGNVRQHSFSSVWHSSKARHVRQRVLACPGCWVECDILPSLYYSPEIVRLLAVLATRGARKG